MQSSDYDTEDTDDENSREIDCPDEDEVFWSDDEVDNEPTIQIIILPKKIPFIPKTTIIVRTECAICLEVMTTSKISYCSSSCGNTFHSKCISTLIKCPICRATPFYRLKCLL